MSKVNVNRLKRVEWNIKSDLLLYYCVSSITLGCYEPIWSYRRSNPGIKSIFWIVWNCPRYRAMGLGLITCGKFNLIFCLKLATLFIELRGIMKF